jgi:DNA-directed RNA polymerase specialized sigma24 family protein
MEELEGSARGVSLRAAACMLAGDSRDPVSGERVRGAVDAQLRRAGVAAQDAADVRTDVVLALLSAPAADLPLPLELVCARAAVIARNKAVDLGRRSARAPIAYGDALPEPRPLGERPGSLADGLDEVAAAAHRRRVRADLAHALESLDAPQRAAIAAHTGGGAARASGLPRSTYYRALAHAQARLRSDLRGRLAGLGALGDLARGARELFAHVEGVHAAAVAGTAAVAVGTAFALSLPTGVGPLHTTAPAPVVIQASGGRVQPVSTRAPAARAIRRRVRVTPRNRTAPSTRPARVAVPTPRPKPCTYDPSAYDC